MAKNTTGQLLERKWRSGRTYAVRVHVYGRRHYLTLGSSKDGWTPPPRRSRAAEHPSRHQARDLDTAPPSAIENRQTDRRARGQDDHLPRVRLALARRAAQ